MSVPGGARSPLRAPASRLSQACRADNNFLSVGYTRTRIPPWGVDNGAEGTPNYVEVLRPGKTAERYAFGTNIPLNKDDVVHVVTGVGGGYGDPKLRSREAIEQDIAAITDAPLIATHCNAHALCPHARNLTDRQLDVIAESGGMVGVNFAAAFLRADGQMNADFDLDVVIRHFDYLIEKLGENGVGFGSDFDGATIPRDISDVSGLPNLRKAMVEAGYGEALMKKLCHENWIDVLRRTWGA